MHAPRNKFVEFVVLFTKKLSLFTKYALSRNSRIYCMATTTFVLASDSRIYYVNTSTLGFYIM